MRFSKVILPATALAIATVSVPSAMAAVIESATIDNWSLAAYSDNRSRDFQSCTMSTSSGEGTDFVLSLNGRNRWGLWLRRSEWPIAQDTTVIATLNLDTGKKAGIAIETTLKSDHILALPLARDLKLPGLFERAATVRVALEHQLHITVSLKNYAKAVDWVKACVAQHAVPQSATAPDATIRAEKPNAGRDDGTLDMEPESKDLKPAPALPAREKPAKPSELIEASAKSDTGASDEKPAIAVEMTPATTPKPQTGTPAQIVAGIATALASAARATTADVVEPRANNTARDLVPGLMQAARLTSFRVLPETQAPATLRRADAVFELEGFRGAVVSLDSPSAATGINEVLAYDRIGCGGVYASTSSTADAATSDVLRATTRCEAGGQVTIAHFVTIARKAGGYYVVAVTGQAPSSAGRTNPVGEVSVTLDEAALAVSGKF